MKSSEKIYSGPSGPSTQDLPSTSTGLDNTSISNDASRTEKVEQTLTMRRHVGQQAPTPKREAEVGIHDTITAVPTTDENDLPTSTNRNVFGRIGNKIGKTIAKFSRFIGPGFLVAVAYMDPGNYATDVAAGATFKFKLLFVVLMSNLIAVFLQSLCIRLGTVTGLNLAENCKAHLPWQLNYFLYFIAEAAIIATDIAEVSINTSIQACTDSSRSLAQPLL
jgi:Natural resistance-associated macrophage protein